MIAEHGATPGAQGLRRGLAILRVLAAGQDAGVALAEVARATGLARPTIHRILAVLAEEGVVERNPRTRRYAIGEQVKLLALARPARLPVLVAAQKVLDSLAEQVGDTLFLTVRTGTDSLCIARRLGRYPIQVLSIEVGARRPLGVSAAGIALLAALPEAAAMEILLANRARLRPYRVAYATALHQVAAARNQDHAVREMGLVAGTKSLSVVLRDAAGQGIAALTVSAVRQRLPARREPELAALLHEAAAAIRRRLTS